MPINVTTDHESADICVTFSGPVLLEDVHEYFSELMRGFDSFGNKKALLLFENIELAGFKFSTICTFAELTKQHQVQLEGSRTAVVASNGLAYGITRMYMAIRDPNYAFAVFRNVTDAIEWLNFEPETLLEKEGRI